MAGLRWLMLLVAVSCAVSQLFVPAASARVDDVLRRLERPTDKIVVEVKNGRFTDENAEEKLEETLSRVRRQAAAPLPPSRGTNLSAIAWPVRLDDPHDILLLGSYVLTLSQ